MISSRVAARAALGLVVCALAACSQTTREPELQGAIAAPVPAVTALPVAGGMTSDPTAEAPRATQTGLASWYGERFHGRLTASGEVYDMHAFTAAHPELPLRSLARITRLDTGASVVVRINDRGPYVSGRIVDLSRAAAQVLGMLEDGLAEVRVEAFGPADPRDRAAISGILPRRGAPASGRGQLQTSSD